MVTPAKKKKNTSGAARSVARRAAAKKKPTKKKAPAARRAKVGGTQRWIEYRPLHSVVPAKQNPKGHALDDLQGSVARFGFIEPIIEDSRTGRLLGGHGRLETLATAEAAGLELPDGLTLVDGRWAVPVVCGWSSPNDAEAKAALVALNRLVELGGWDLPDLTKMLDSLRTTDAGLVGTGYTEPDLEGLLQSLPQNWSTAEQYNTEPTSDDYYTPAWVFEKLALRFDLDVCSPPQQLPWIPAARRFTIEDDGLTQPWSGRVWMNPPFSKPAQWVMRFLEHGDGVAIVPFSKSAWTEQMWADPRCAIVSGPKDMKFVGGAIFMPIYFIAIGASNIAALHNLGPVRTIARPRRPTHAA